MPFGHASHQTGLDVDIWLDLSPKAQAPVAAREDIRTISLVLPDETGVSRTQWLPGHATLIRLAAEAPGVDRVLVNHAIKRELCRANAGAPWLRRVRPWRGHDAHMHVRLRCPPGEGGVPRPAARRRPAMAATPPSPGGSRRKPGNHLRARPSQPPPPPLPAACAAVLGAPRR